MNTKRKNGYHSNAPYISREKLHNLPYDVARCLTEPQRIRYSAIASNYASGRHILQITLQSIEKLDKNIVLKAEAIYEILGETEATALNISLMPNKEDIKMKYRINAVAAHLSRAIELGYDKVVNRLSIPGLKVSYEEVKKAAKAVRTRNAILSYDGNTIRDFLAFKASYLNDESTITEEENKVRRLILDKEYLTLQNYKNIKSLPFSLLRYKKDVRINENMEVSRPDIEAKYNLRKILGQEKYDAANIDKISLKKATILESQLINVIKKTMQNEVMLRVKEKILNLPEGILKDDMMAACKVSNVANVTSRWIIDDIVQNIEDQVNFVEEAMNYPQKCWSDKQKVLFSQIEYQALNNLPREELNGYMSEIKVFLNGEYCMYDTIEPFVKARSCPYEISQISNELLTPDEITNIKSFF